MRAVQADPICRASLLELFLGTVSLPDDEVHPVFVFFSPASRDRSDHLAPRILDIYIYIIQMYNISSPENNDSTK